FDVANRSFAKPNARSHTFVAGCRQYCARPLDKLSDVQPSGAPRRTDRCQMVSESSGGSAAILSNNEGDIPVRESDPRIRRLYSWVIPVPNFASENIYVNVAGQFNLTVHAWDIICDRDHAGSNRQHQRVRYRCPFVAR